MLNETMNRKEPIMKAITAAVLSPAKAVVAVGVSAVLAASLALAAPATAQAKTVKKPAKVKKPSVSKVKATSFKVSWKKAKRAKGYQVKVVKGSKTVKTITVKKKYCYVTGLSAKTTYKVKVRAYNQSGKKKKYGKWSAIRKVTTSKQSSSYAGWAGFTWNSKTQTWEYQRPSTGTETHVHSWNATGAQTSGSMRVYYCLECGEQYTDASKLHDHAESTGHLQNQGYYGYIYEDGVKVKRAESAQLKTSPYAYSYVTFNGVSLAQANSNPGIDACSCGSTKTHAHNWKKVSGKKSSFYWERYYFSCGWATDWAHEGYNVGDACDEHIVSNKHYSDTSWYGYKEGSKTGYYYSSFDYYQCSDCGLKALDLS